MSAFGRVYFQAHHLLDVTVGGLAGGLVTLLLERSAATLGGLMGGDGMQDGMQCFGWVCFLLTFAIFKVVMKKLKSFGDGDTPKH